MLQRHPCCLLALQMAGRSASSASRRPWLQRQRRLAACAPSAGISGVPGGACCSRGGPTCGTGRYKTAHADCAAFIPAHAVLQLPTLLPCRLSNAAASWPRRRCRAQRWAEPPPTPSAAAGGTRCLAARPCCRLNPEEPIPRAGRSETPTPRIPGLRCIDSLTSSCAAERWDREAPAPASTADRPMYSDVAQPARLSPPFIYCFGSCSTRKPHTHEWKSALEASLSQLAARRAVLRPKVAPHQPCITSGRVCCG